ncbi:MULTISPECIES: VOC family protein [Streptomyces]|uniref:Lactoylglutathione lyase n=1 Tax=Streptomyces canarius TaxID=285453 RepID=A0ABQ3CTY9_9ACTN|nr:VOC family protein [Streptomyces canarius]GHA33955.1 putative lactoylglutathione lyase [Streptomyces canarius]
MVGVRLDHLRVDVKDIDRAERFYSEALGLRRIVRYETENGVILQMGPGGAPPGVELWFESGLEPRPSATEHLAFAVDDVHGLLEHVRALGYEVVREPWQIGDETVAFVRDPDGHLVELNDFAGR